MVLINNIWQVSFFNRNEEIFLWCLEMNIRCLWSGLFGSSKWPRPILWPFLKLNWKSVSYQISTLAHFMREQLSKLQKCYLKNNSSSSSLFSSTLAVVSASNVVLIIMAVLWTMETMLPANVSSAFQSAPLLLSSWRISPACVVVDVI